MPEPVTPPVIVAQTTQTTQTSIREAQDARRRAFEIKPPENPFAAITPSPLDTGIPGYGLLRLGFKTQGILAIGITMFFLTLMVLNWQLFSGGLKSLGISLLLAVVSFSDLTDVFTVDILEFWVASLYCLIGIGLAWGFSVRTYRRLVKRGVQTKATMSLWQIAWREFKKRSISMICLVIVALLYSTALLAPMLAPFDPNAQQDFVATQFQPPLTTMNVLIMNDAESQTIPLREGDSFSNTLTNALITQNYALRFRGETERKLFVQAWRVEGEKVIVKQGANEQNMREREFDLNQFQRDPQNPAQPLATQKTYIMGTDPYGRDMLSRVIYGSRISLSIGLLVVMIAITLGMVLGVVAAYYGGFIDDVIMRSVDVIRSFPSLFLILIIIALFGNSIFLIVFTISLTGWTGVSRLVRSQVLSLKEQEFVQAARALGLSNSRIIFRHLVPNSLTPVIIAATLSIGGIILTEAALSFLGLGVQPPTASWGNIVSEGRDNLLYHWWISTFPGLAIVLTVVSFNLVGDGVRDALDPRQRQ
jgi:peptide/nickel transport system permease protein